MNTFNNLNLCFSSYGERIIKLNDEEIAIAGNKKIYLIDFNNYLILNEINCDYRNDCILKLSNNLILIGDSNGTITQYRIEKKRLIKESFKNKSHEINIFSLTLINDMIISGSINSKEIKIWKIEK